MGLFFNKPKIECPRCSGKGKVDWGDIEILKMDLKWAPGKCGYCEGKGKVTQQMLENVPVDMTYLTADLPKEERKRLFKNDLQSHYRAEMFDQHLEDMIKQIKYLYNICELDREKIHCFYLLNSISSESIDKDSKKMKAYIDRVIDKQNNNNEKGYTEN